MKKNYLWGICAVMALSSCSQDEVVSVPQTGISYSVVTDKASRAQAVFCNNNLPDHFYVSAELTQGTNSAATYFTEDLLTNSDGSYSQTNSRYWPEEGSLNFYAYANGNKETGNPEAVTFSLAEKKITGYEVGTDVAKQKDLIYAVKTGQTKEANSSSDVSLNFRHALSQIVFQAQNKNENIYVEISGVEIHNVANKGDFTFPNAATDGNIEDHDQNGADADPDGATTDTDNTISNQGTWGLTTGSTADYAVTFDAVAVKGNGAKVSLTNNVVFESSDDVTSSMEGNDSKEQTNSKLAMLLLPQETEAFTVPSPWDATKLEEKGAGAFFYVACKIWNVAGDEYNPSTDVLVYSNENAAKNILIPVKIDWKQGHKYVYTFIFDKTGNGGTDPEGGEPVLVPITYTITVDDFTNESETVVEMNTDNL